jgi:lactate dehydrogenase-like 2-hydroxyacid dehydrogenase
MRNNGIDIVHAKKNGVVVSGTGVQGNSTLEHIWALILATARGIAEEDRRIKDGNERWQTKLPFGLHGKTLGLVGVGKLGAQTAQVGC